jgi:hypothetical protein
VISAIVKRRGRSGVGWRGWLSSWDAVKLGLCGRTTQAAKKGIGTGTKKCRRVLIMKLRKLVASAFSDIFIFKDQALFILALACRRR